MLFFICFKFPLHIESTSESCYFSSTKGKQITRTNDKTAKTAAEYTSDMIPQFKKYSNCSEPIVPRGVLA